MGMKLNYVRMMILGSVLAAVSFAVEKFLGGGSSSGSLLITMVFWIGIAEGCVALMAAAEISHGKWHRPIMNRMFSAYPMILAMTLFFVVRATQLEQYPWADGHGFWLNENIFIGRHVVMLVLGWLLARKFISDTLRGLPSRRLWAVIYAFYFMIHMSSVGFEWVMSLEKPWFSTLFGAWFMVGAWLSAICTAAIVLFRQRGAFDDGLRYTQKSIGGLMFGFATFWAYFYFSQLIVIWYGNIPEETTYLARRIGYHTPYWLVARLIFGLVWVVPFTVLLSRLNKTRPPVTAGLACVILAGLMLEFWLCVHPVAPVQPIAAAIHFGLLGFLFVSILGSGAHMLPDGGREAVPAGAGVAHSRPAV